jgi:hypothetical protein
LQIEVCKVSKITATLAESVLLIRKIKCWFTDPGKYRQKTSEPARNRIAAPE